MNPLKISTIGSLGRSGVITLFGKKRNSHLYFVRRKENDVITFFSDHTLGLQNLTVVLAVIEEGNTLVVHLLAVLTLVPRLPVVLVQVLVQHVLLLEDGVAPGARVRHHLVVVLDVRVQRGHVPEHLRTLRAADRARLRVRLEVITQLLVLGKLGLAVHADVGHGPVPRDNVRQVDVLLELLRRLAEQVAVRAADARQGARLGAREADLLDLSLPAAALLWPGDLLLFFKLIPVFREENLTFDQIISKC